MARRLERPLLFATAGAGLTVLACNAAVGGGLVALMGGAGYMASQCYDRVRVRVLDAHSGLRTCDAEVWVSDASDVDSERRLRSCYNAALTEGRWKLTARRPGYRPMSTEIEIAERSGECPHYTHSIELTLRPEGSPSVTATLAPAQTPVAPPAPPQAFAPPQGTAPAPPSTLPAVTLPAVSPSVPTGTFDVIAADAGSSNIL